MGDSEAANVLFEFLGIDLILPHLSVGSRSVKVQKKTKKRDKKRTAQEAAVPKKRRKRSGKTGEAAFTNMVKGAFLAVQSQQKFQALTSEEMKEIMHSVIDSL